MKLAYIYSVVYKSRCLYIGSTWNFTNRLTNHLRTCYSRSTPDYNKNLYKFIRSTDVWAAFNFSIIDTIETDDSDVDRGEIEKLTAEQFYIDLLEPSLNSKDAILTPKERRLRGYKNTKRWNQQNLLDRRYTCDPCGFNGVDKYALQIHYTRNKHKKNAIKNQYNIIIESY